ncbi:MAG: serine/threonine-protein phosphatase [Rhodospirillaceae bacterium]|nr:serine/threonine-protein phosphatase [Rhodospirillaceae bacterium]MBT7449477.1 serine/threonine-protein phosphatase [Rhodospirillaceae bacterium]
MNMISPEPEALQCLEVRGGNSITNEVISAADITLAIYARPFAENDQGGDIHYISACGTDQIIRIALADVSGHGEAVGELARGLQTIMRENIETIDHTAFVRSLNEEFAKLSTGGNFATALISAYYRPDNTLILCNAGHPPPFHYVAASNTWSMLDDSAGNPTPGISDVPLGVIAGTDYSQIAVSMNPGDMVLMYSDSLNESQNPEGQQLHEEGLLELVKTLPTIDGATLCEATVDVVSAYRNGNSADDDESVLVVWRPPT